MQTAHSLLLRTRGLGLLFSGFSSWAAPCLPPSVPCWGLSFLRTCPSRDMVTLPHVSCSICAQTPPKRPCSPGCLPDILCTCLSSSDLLNLDTSKRNSVPAAAPCQSSSPPQRPAPRPSPAQHQCVRHQARPGRLSTPSPASCSLPTRATRQWRPLPLGRSAGVH